MKKEIDTNWKQLHVVHCPKKDCTGMLLQSPYLHEEKCDTCERYFILAAGYTETEKPRLMQKTIESSTNSKSNENLRDKPKLEQFKGCLFTVEDDE